MKNGENLAIFWEGKIWAGTSILSGFSKVLWQIDSWGKIPQERPGAGIPSHDLLNSSAQVYSQPVVGWGDVFS
jgi:hypothetical protein